VLVVEDDPGTARFLRQGLEEDGHTVDVATDGVEGRVLGHGTHYDLMLLDVNLPGLSGLQLARELRQGGIETPILMLTALGATHDVVEGLDAGADDYLTKPFEFDELLARVRALTRRRSATSTGVLRAGALELNRLSRLVRCDDRVIDLSPREFRLLEFLLLHLGEAVTRTRLLEGVWGMTFDPHTNVVEAHISNLRRKLEQYGMPRLVHTVRGAGYTIRVDNG